MNSLPEIFLPIILPFASLFSKRVWPSAMVLLVGAISAPGKRTVSAILRVMGLSAEPHFQTYHRVLNQALSDVKALEVSRQSLGKFMSQQSKGIVR